VYILVNWLTSIYNYNNVKTF